MALEIERKFLARYIPDMHGYKKLDIKQGYLLNLFNTVVRIRKSNDNGYITIKRKTGLKTLGVNEYEYSIPGWVASLLLSVSFLGYIDKTRYEIPYKGHVIELDVFGGRHLGLVVAEVELTDPDEQVDLPAWVGEEVTGQKQYYNYNLGKR